jgi:Mg2+/Co2+ transporter CorC
MIQVLDKHTSILDGRLGLSEVNDRMGLELPEDEADTIGGFVFGLLGHQADQGERLRREDVVFVVEATDGRRITKIRLIRLEGDPPPPQPDASSREPANGAAAAHPADRRSIETSGVETAPPSFFRS